ncbi:hypothetical protein ACH35V_33160 [Actinomadura sp. 1N219]|uniref:hypothetical protein n=1 Tax=Actinomadura sp. 1N219 TaxID=3375152 RepID=UPI00379F26DC
MKSVLVLSGAVLALSLGVGGCGSESEGSAGVKGSASPTSELEKKLSAPKGQAGSIQGDPLTPEQLKMATKFVACMRKLGYDMPEPSDPAFNFAPKNAQGMDRQELLKVRSNSAICHKEAGGSAMTGG